MKKNENWVDVPGWEGYYQVSDQGRFKSLERKVNSRYGKNRTVKERILKPSTSDRYAVVSFSKGQKMASYNAHRVVMLAFIGPSDLYVDHINNDKTDNRLCNLRYVTALENQSNRIDNKSGRTTSKYPGVYYCKHHDRWVAKITVNKKTKRRYMKTEEEAIAARKNLELNGLIDE